jgi:eukaryotic-like serine/threonine-protein kinase
VDHQADLVANRYRIIGEVARGGCGAVFEAHDLHMDRLVAIKILQAGGFDRAAAARFARESRVAAAIHHPNVCTVTDSGMLDDGSPFLVMERLYGETLRAYIARAGRLDAEEAIELGVQMLSGLDAAHLLGIVHRDMKPENVFLVRPKGLPTRVKLLDFGMCRRSSVEISLDQDDHSLTRAGTVVGTPEYMAPEQASGRREFDQRIDLYAVGVMLYEMLTGTRAFSGPDPRSVLVSVLARQLPSVRAIRPELPVAVDRIVARAVERDPRSRYSATGDFQHDLLLARTTLRRQRAARAEVEARQRSEAAPWDMPTLHHAAKFRRPA